jgi:hypothetical protein
VVVDRIGMVFVVEGIVDEELGMVFVDKEIGMFSVG